ncbi:alpha/beta fold hydrolase [Arthrobacter globiformis]|uniref:alpha/beta fold hydrolase n=1 Tax=Arthrobacter globiformis TaxID=1665 RepID=UPI0027920BF8|nr:alpha/beta hydrolase [Arthrobacter globiformis]MDQ0619160.1 pimeloyl-ACP methyl ester carboxylesterase [Arthrobacter globiformis]
MINFQHSLPAPIMTATASSHAKSPRRRLRTVGFTAVIVAGLLLVSTFANVAMNQAERSATAPYGQRVQTSHGALNVVRAPGNGRTGQSIVLLSGLGTPAPALDFAPLVRELGDYDVVVVEGFGYGYSDQPPVERTVENITSELHEALANADVPRPYVLAGHSIAGFYTLAYANRYRNDVAAVIGIDPTVPAARTIHADETGVPTGGINWEGLIATSGLLRWATTLAPSLVEPDGTAYTSRERDQMRKMATWNFGNPSVLDETNRIADNARKVQGMRYPDDVPVLTFVASAKETPADLALHESRLQNVRKHETVTLPGGHYLHWTHAPAMASTINAFLTTNTPGAR